VRKGLINILGIKLSFKPSWLGPIAKTILKPCDIPSSVKVKVKFILEQAMKIHQRGCRGIALLFL
jgi:hypothetical protein